jgi:GntR family transcriptional repressor for pyruvate dehydrogenase complex
MNAHADLVHRGREDAPRRGVTTIRPFKAMDRRSLSDRLATEIKESIQRGNYLPGDRLPPIMVMAQGFGVGHPSVREALKKLEAMGIVEIRHGSGVYVNRSEELLVLPSPDYAGQVTRKLLLDLVIVRLPLEVQSAAEAAVNASDADLREMEVLLTAAGENLDAPDRLTTLNMRFHEQIALASGNTVRRQLLSVLHQLFVAEQRLIMDIFGSRERDHHEHLGILEALRLRDVGLSSERMQSHLDGVRSAIERWDVNTTFEAAIPR